MKRYICYLIILISLISILWTVQLSTAKYKDTSEINLSITSTPLYFEHSGTNIKIPYNNNTANIDLTVHNYIDKYCTLENINYEISITNSNYTFSVDGISATENVVPLEIQGGDRHSSILHIEFSRLDTTDIPAYEDVEVIVKTSYPYSYQSSFTVTITNGAIEVLGNPTNWTKDNVTLEVVHVTEGTELTEYSFDGGNTWQAESTKTYTKNVEGLQIYAKDTIGSLLGPVEVDITKIDNTAPEFQITNDIEYNADGTTKEVETLIVYLGESTSVLKNINAHDTQSGLSETGIKCYVGDMEITTTDIATTVGRYKLTYKVQDNLGNESTIEREALVRWPLAGKYVVARQNVIGSGVGTETIGMGLYADDETTGKDTNIPFASKYYYSGKTVDNYVSFPNTSRDGTSATTWRIINVAENDTVKIIVNTKLNDKYTLSDTAINRWKVHKMAFFTQTIPGWISSGYVGDNSSDYYINFSDTGHIQEAIFYIGAVYRRGTDASESSTLLEVTDERTNISAYEGDYGSEEALGMLAWKSKLGIINVTDVTKSANSANVFSIRSMQENQSAFEDTSWMHLGETEWSLNACSSQSNQFWRLEDTQFVSKLTSNIYKGVMRPVVYLKNDTILSGTGTSGDPFVVQEDWRWFDTYQVVQ